MDYLSQSIERSLGFSTLGGVLREPFYRVLELVSRFLFLGLTCLTLLLISLARFVKSDGKLRVVIFFFWLILSILESGFSYPGIASWLYDGLSVFVLLKVFEGDFAIP